jgi:hypothetical protein
MSSDSEQQSESAGGGAGEGARDDPWDEQASLSEPRADLVFPPANTAKGASWRKVMRGQVDDEVLGTLRAEDLLGGFGLLMRRMEALETERRNDRLVLEEYSKECARLNDKYEEVAALLDAAKTTALYAGPAPSFQSLSLAQEPRRMSMPELEWVQKMLETKIKQNDKRLPQIAQIMQLEPTEAGLLHIDFAAASPSKQWQLYYYLLHKRVVCSKMNPRAVAVSASIGKKAVSGLQVMPASAGDLQTLAGFQSSPGTSAQYSLDDMDFDEANDGAGHL